MRLIQTCPAVPEQYDVMDGDEKIGYLRLRHGYFAAYLDVTDDVPVYEAEPMGDGIFFPDEREFFIGEALAAIVRARTPSLIANMEVR